MKLSKISLAFSNGCEVTCYNEAGFSSAFEAAQMIHNSDIQMESMHIAYVHELVEKSKKNQR